MWDGRGKPRIMMLEGIVAHETYEKIMPRALYREYRRN